MLVAKDRIYMPTARSSALALFALCFLITGCASPRVPQLTWNPPAFLGGGSSKAAVAKDENGQVIDSYASRMQPRTTALASADRSAAHGAGGGSLVTHSTAPPTDAFLTTPPIEVAVGTDSAAWSRPPSGLPVESMPPDGSDPTRWGSAPKLEGPATPAPDQPGTHPSAAVSPPAPTTPPGPVNQLAQVREVVSAARQALDMVPNYQVRLHRQERVGASLQPEEDVVLNIRRQPKAVRLEWPDGPHKGREVIYASGPQGSGLMHVNMPNSLMPRISLPPDSPLALQNSRHPITDAGLDDVVARIERTIRACEANPAIAGRLRYEGLKEAVPGGPACHTIRDTTPAGETWIVAFDSQTHVPALIQAQAANGELLERYVFRDFKGNLPDLMTAAAFDPDARWGAPRGLFSRLARGAEGGDPTQPANPIR